MSQKWRIYAPADNSRPGRFQTRLTYIKPKESREGSVFLSQTVLLKRSPELRQDMLHEAILSQHLPNPTQTKIRP